MSENDRPTKFGTNVSFSLPSSKSASNPSVSHSYSKVSKVSQKRDGNVLYILPKPEQEMDDLHTCSACQIIFTSVEEYLQHKQTIHSKGGAAHSDILVEGLSESTVRSGEMAMEVVTAAEERNSSAFDSELEKPSTSSLSLSEAKQNTSILYKCSDCLDLFPDVTHLQKHMMEVHRVSITSEKPSGSPHSSTTAGADNTAQANQVFHMELVGFDNEQRTDGNIKSNAAALSLKRTLEKPVTFQGSTVMSPEAVKKVKCELCGKSLKDISSYKGHLLTHSSHRGFVCTWEGCTYSFKTKGSLKRHVRRHTDERPFKCDMCLRTFRESGALTRHLKSRTACTVKTDADLPKYKKSIGFNQNIPAAATTALEQEDSGKPVLASALLNVSEETVEVNIKSPQEQENLQNSVVPASERVLDEVKNTPMMVKVVTVYNSQTGKKIQLAVPTTTRIIDTSTITQKVPTAELPGIKEKTSELDRVVIVGNTPEESQKKDFEITDETLSNDKETPTYSMVTSHHQGSDTELPVELDFVESEDAKMRTAILINTDLHEEPNMVEGLIAETINLKEESMEMCLVAESDSLGEDDPVCDIAQQQEEQELGLSMEVVTCAGEEALVTHVVEGQGQTKPEEVEEEGLEIDERQGVPLTNKRKCQACSEYLGDEITLKDHLKTHLIAAGYKCPSDGCKYIAPKQNSLALHMQVVHEHAVVKVEEDEEETEEQEDVDPAVATLALRQLLELQGNLDSQVLLQSNSQPVKVLHGCPVCQRKFTLNYLKLHIRTHTGEKPYPCQYCGKQFRTKDTLTKHLPTHSDLRKYECGECGKMFKRISHAREHLKVHSQDRRYCCTLCNKSFKSANGCKVHMRTHSTLLPWVCRFCNKSFREKGGLDRHVRTHTGEKPYKCRLCGRGFAEHGTLSRHYKAKVPCTSGTRQMSTLTVMETKDEEFESSLVEILPCNDNMEDTSLNSESSGVAPVLQIVPNTGEELAVIQYSTDAPDDATIVASADTTAAQFVTLVGGDETSHVITTSCIEDTVLEEFSTVVADTQQYIVGRTISNIT